MCVHVIRMSLLKIAVEKLPPSTAIFNSDIQLSVYPFSCFVSVCPFGALLKATYVCRKFAHCFVLSTLKSIHCEPLVCFDLPQCPFGALLKACMLKMCTLFFPVHPKKEAFIF